MSDPWITIAIPAYNRPHLLRRAIESVLDQTDPAWELWIVDDRSTDDTWELARRFAGGRPNINAVQNPSNLGLAANFRQASTKGNSPYLLLLAADDFLHPSFLEVMRGIVQEDASLAIVCGQRIHFLAKNGKTREYRTLLSGKYNPGATVARALGNGNLYGLYSSVVVKRAALESIGGINFENTWAGDYEAWVRLAARYPIYFTSKALAFQHVDDTTQTAEILRNGSLVEYEVCTIRRLLADTQVRRHLTPDDQTRGYLRIQALEWAMTLYQAVIRQRPKMISPRCDFPRQDPVLVGLTLLRLLWNRIRLTY